MAMRGHTTDEVIAWYQAHPEERGRPAQGLTASQHILHLLLTIVTAGLWLPVWIYLSLRGQKPPPAGSAGRQRTL